MKEQHNNRCRQLLRTSVMNGVRIDNARSGQSMSTLPAHDNLRLLSLHDSTNATSFLSPEHTKCESMSQRNNFLPREITFHESLQLNEKGHKSG